ncbi:MAG: alpha-beta hydrolase superfamily lysophospholipase [Litorivivens sp.]
MHEIFTFYYFAATKEITALTKSTKIIRPFSFDFSYFHAMPYMLSIDRSPLWLNSWKIPKDEEEFCILLVHGMAEHSGRYENFAKFCNLHKGSVHAVDLRGFGKSIDDENGYGFIIDGQGWKTYLHDIDCALTEARADSIAPTFMMGHSMGALLVLSYMQECAPVVDGWIISGLPEVAGIKDIAGNVLGRLQGTLWRMRAKGYIHAALSFVLWNKKFKPNRTKFDWLSRDENEVDKYIADPLCGRVVTARLFSEIQHAATFAWSKRLLEKMPSEVPMYMFAGADDPVIGGKAGFEKQVKILGKYLDNMTTHVYDGARHECLNETNVDEVMDDFINWMLRQLD